MPRRIPDDGDFRVEDAFEIEQRIFHAPRNVVVRGTTRRRQRHRHFHDAVGNGDVVNQAKVNDVPAGFRVPCRGVKMGCSPTFGFPALPHIVALSRMLKQQHDPQEPKMKRTSRKEASALNALPAGSRVITVAPPVPVVSEASAALLRELVAHLRQNRTQLREEWARRITEAQLLTAMTKDEIFTEATSVYDNYVEVLETGSVEALQAYARNLSERIIPRGVETNEVVGIVLLLRDVLARSLFKKYQADFDLLNQVLDAYEPAANRIANTVAVSFVQERERVIRQQQEAIRELSTPVLQVRERLLILPIIGVIDSQRARQLTEQLLRGIRQNRAKVVVVDITGVPTIDSTVANHLVQTVEASRLMGASVIITGLSSEIAQTLVTIGVDLSKMNAVGDLQGGIEEAERLLGYKVISMAEAVALEEKQ
jgi:rsbT co-antagonist protein RsbR